jgi:hypothetical protein
MTFSVITLGLCAPSTAQKKYTPNHPEVEAMVRRGLDYMVTKIPQKQDRRVLAALTIVETSKRYDSMVPVDNPIVAATVEKIVEEVDKGTLQKDRSLYHPALALICNPCRPPPKKMAIIMC